jgi:hypothetical protein
VVFFPAAEARAYSEIAGRLAGLSILMVGEMSGFAELSGMINFVIGDDHVRFKVNPSSAARPPQGELEAAATGDHRRRRATRKIEQRLYCSALRSV